MDAAIALAEVEDAGALLAEYPITVAAYLAEFDDERIHERIQRAYRWKGEGEVRHEVERIRQDLAAHAALTHAAEVIAAQHDVTVHTQRPSWQDTASETLERLGLDEADHAAGCPDHFIVIEEAFIAAECDHSDHDDDEDCWTEESDPIYCEVDGVAYTAEAYCADWHGNGHTHPWKKAPTTAPATGDAEADAKAKAAASAERKRVIAGNKAWAASHAVRAEFIDQLAQRKSAIPGGAIFALEALQDSRDLTGTYGDNRIDTTGMNATKATNALVTWICRSRQVNAASDQGKSLWRGGSDHSASIARFLRFLQSVGYTLSAAEEAAVGGEPYAIPAED